MGQTCGPHNRVWDIRGSHYFAHACPTLGALIGCTCIYRSLRHLSSQPERVIRAAGLAPVPEPRFIRRSRSAVEAKAENIHAFYGQPLQQWRHVDGALELWVPWPRRGRVQNAVRDAVEQPRPTCSPIPGRL